MLATKSPFKSKTLWFNVITALVVIATFFGYTPNATVANEVSGFLLLASPAVNFALRFFTKQPIVNPS